MKEFRKAQLYELLYQTQGRPHLQKYPSSLLKVAFFELVVTKATSFRNRHPLQDRDYPVVLQG